MSKEPKYRQVEESIRQMIQLGTLKVGDQIPTEEELCEKFGFSRMTVNKALSNLSASGYIERVPGRGSFVRRHHVDKSLSAGTSFTEDMAAIGLKAGSKLLSYEVVPATAYPKAQEALELSDDDLAYVRSSRLGFVFQSFNLMPRATVLRNVMLPLVYSDIAPRERELLAWKALRAVGLPEEHFLHRANELSGGQMQRVAIARALVNDPAIILADEPTGNLDTATGELVMKTFRRLQKRGKTIVLITHDAEVAAWADRTVHIRDGRLLTDEQERAVQAQLTGGIENAGDLGRTRLAPRQIKGVPAV